MRDDVPPTGTDSGADADQSGSVRPAAPVEIADPQALMTLFREIGIIYQLATTRLERVLPHDLTLAQFSLLEHLNRLGDATHGDWSPQRLANAFQVTKGTMTSTLKRAEGKGFVSVSPDPDDGRAKIVTLTETGRAALGDVYRAMAPELALVGQALAGQDVAALTPELEKIRATLDEMR
jgi:DNA-binding MarR family transcriptional regulator